MLCVAASYYGIFGVTAHIVETVDETIKKCNKIDEALTAIHETVDKFKLKADDFTNILEEGRFASEIKDKSVVIDWNSQEVILITDAANRLYNLLDV